MLPCLVNKQNSFSDAFRSYVEAGLPRGEQITRVQYIAFAFDDASYQIYQSTRDFKKIDAVFVAIFKRDKEMIEYMSIPQKDFEAFESGLVVTHGLTKRYNFEMIDRLFDLYRKSNHPDFNWCNHLSGWPLIRNCLYAHLFQEQPQST